MNRSRYTDETYTTIQAVAGKTIEWVATQISIATNEVCGLRFHFTDGTEAIVDTPTDTALDFARGTGLYAPERQAI